MRVAIAFVRLRWRLLHGAVRRGGSDQVGAIVSIVASALVGLGLGGAAVAIRRADEHAPDLAVIFYAIIVIATVGFGVVAGITQPIDPRVVAPEPLTDRQRAIGILAASAFGPPGLAGIMIAIGLVAGTAYGAATLPLLIVAALSWVLSLLLVARTATNLLALLINRLPRLGQMVVGLFALVFYGGFQLVPAVISNLDDDERHQLADWLAWSPPGQIGRAVGEVGDSQARALLHLAIGSLWLPALAIGFVISTRRLAMSVRRHSGQETTAINRSPLGRLVRRVCGEGIVGAIAWRSILTRFRTPRTALEAFAGAGIGLSAVLVPTLTRDTAGSGAVLVGGAVQLAVLFMSGNSFGSDGPAVTHELLAGADLRQLVRGKARSIAIVASPLAVVGPVVAAGITGEWRYLVAGIGVGVGGLLAGSGAALVQSSLVPIAMPESDNPFASGESGKGLFAAVLLVFVLAGLALVTVPVALGLFWATQRGSIALVTIAGGLTVAAGALVLWIGIRLATARLGGREPDFIVSVTPAR